MAEGKNLYETVIVTSAKLGEEGSAALVERFKALIAEHGTVQSVDDWGKRRFAGPEFTAELDRRYHITDGIMRTLIVKRDPRHLAKPQQRAQKSEEAGIDVEAIAVEAVEESAE